MPLVSVIVPTRNRNHLLGRALESLVSQEFDDFEVVVVDTNENDQQVQKEPGLIRFLQDSRIRVITHPESTNPAAARNIGLRHARGEWITYLDDDDAYRPEKIKRQLAVVLETESPIVLCGLCYHLGRRTRNRQCSTSLFRGDEILLNAQAATPCFFHRNMPELFFEEDLEAMEDAVFFHEFIQSQDLDRIHNVAIPLIDVYPQPGTRVNTRQSAVWAGMRRLHRKFANRYTPRARRIYAWRAVVTRYALGYGSLTRLCNLVLGFIFRNGWRELRFGMNAIACRLPLVRKWFVR